MTVPAKGLRAANQATHMTVAAIWPLLWSMTLVFLIALHALAHASPPADFPRPSKPVTAYIVVPAGMQPDQQGNFEIEVYCQAHVPIELMSIHVGHSDGVAFAPSTPTVLNKNTLLLFKGSANRGETLVWRLKAMLSAVSHEKAEEFPESLTLYIEYVLPRQEVIQAIEADPGLDPVTRHRLIEAEHHRAQDNPGTLIRAIPLAWP